MRVALGADPVSGRSAYRSVTVHGDRDAAVQAQARWAAKAELVRSRGRSRPGITVGQVLGEWLAAEHGWKRSTCSGYRSTVRFLIGDAVAQRRAVDAGPEVMVAAARAWRLTGGSDSTVWSRLRVLRSAVGWAWQEHIIDVHPLQAMAVTPHVGTRMHARPADVRRILATADSQLDRAHQVYGRRAAQCVHRAEQLLLLARLAADTGARRGELAALQLADLDGDVLTICRAASMEVIGPTKTSTIRRITLGAGVAQLWRDTVAGWVVRNDGVPVGPWLFSASPAHEVRLTTSCLAHWFSRLRDDAGHHDVTLHRLRHTVATVLVSQGRILEAQYRLGHREATTTLRTYSHVLPLTDAATAATLDALYRP